MNPALLKLAQKFKLGNAVEITLDPRIEKCKDVPHIDTMLNAVKQLLVLPGSYNINNYQAYFRKNYYWFGIRFTPSPNLTVFNPTFLEEAALANKKVEFYTPDNINYEVFLGTTKIYDASKSKSLPLKETYSNAITNLLIPYDPFAVEVNPDSILSIKGRETFNEDFLTATTMWCSFTVDIAGEALVQHFKNECIANGLSNPDHWMPQKK